MNLESGVLGTKWRDPLFIDTRMTCMEAFQKVTTTQLPTSKRSAGKIS